MKQFGNIQRLILGGVALGLLLACGSGASSDGMAGEVAKDFSVSLVGSKDSEMVKLSDYKGKVVLIDFWATWCGPCKMLTPTIEEMHRKYKDDGFVVLAVSNEPEEPLLKYEKEEKPPYPLYRDFAGMAYGSFSVGVIPRSIIVGRDGKIVKDIEGADVTGLAEAINAAMK